MRLFLDTSVILSACGSDRGASRKIFRLALAQNWTLIATPYVVGEVLRNLDKVSSNAEETWAFLRGNVVIEEDVLTLDRPTFFTTSKDRPILFGALAWADLLLTVDKGDFEILGGSMYELSICEPGDFLNAERLAGNLKKLGSLLIFDWFYATCQGGHASYTFSVPFIFPADRLDCSPLSLLL